MKSLYNYINEKFQITADSKYISSYDALEGDVHILSGKEFSDIVEHYKNAPIKIIYRETDREMDIDDEESKVVYVCPKSQHTLGSRDEYSKRKAWEINVVYSNTYEWLLEFNKHKYDVTDFKAKDLIDPTRFYTYVSRKNCDECQRVEFYTYSWYFSTKEFEQYDNYAWYPYHIEYKNHELCIYITKQSIINALAAKSKIKKMDFEPDINFFNKSNERNIYSQIIDKDLLQSCKDIPDKKKYIARNGEGKIFWKCYATLVLRGPMRREDLLETINMLEGSNRYSLTSYTSYFTEWNSGKMITKNKGILTAQPYKNWAHWAK